MESALYTDCKPKQKHQQPTTNPLHSITTAQGLIELPPALETFVPPIVTLVVKRNGEWRVEN